MSEKREGTKYYERMELGRSGMVLTMIMLVFSTWTNSQVSLLLKLLAGLFLIVPFYIIRIDSSARLKRALLIETTHRLRTVQILCKCF